MKKLALLAASFVLSVSMLVGCTAPNDEASSNGGETPSNSEIDEALQAELEAMYEANALESVFNTHVIVNFTAETWAIENGEEVFQYVDRESYSSAGSGMMFHIETEDAYGDIFGYATYARDDAPFADCSSMPSIDFTALGVYPSGEYMELAAQQWLFRGPMALERVLSTAVDEASGTKMIATEIVYEESGISIETIYFIDAATGFLTGYEQATYDTALNECVDITRANIWYDEPRDFISDPVSDVFSGDDLCNLTVVLNPGQENEEIQTFSVVKGTSVSVTTLGGYEMYYDAECTDPCDDVATDVDEAIVYVKLIA